MNSYKILTLAMLISTELVGMERPPQPPRKLPTFGQMIKETTEAQEKLQQEVSRKSYIAQLPPELQDLTQLKNFPGDLKRYIIPLIISGNPQQIAQGIYTTAAIDKHFHKLINNPEIIIAILDSLHYTANGIDVVEHLQAKTATLPVMRSKQIQDWLTAAEARLEKGEELCKAINKKDQMTVTRLLTNKNINFHDRVCGCRINKCVTCHPLSNAVYLENIGIIKLLLAAGANPNIESLCGDNIPLIEASRKGNVDIAKLLLTYGANPNIKEQGITALMYAAEYGHIKIVELLLASGANPDLTNDDGHQETARDYAFNNKHHDIIELLDKAMAQRNKQPQSIPEEKSTDGCAVS